MIHARALYAAGVGLVALAAYVEHGGSAAFSVVGFGCLLLALIESQQKRKD